MSASEEFKVGDRVECDCVGLQFEGVVVEVVRVGNGLGGELDHVTYIVRSDTGGLQPTWGMDVRRAQDYAPRLAAVTEAFNRDHAKDSSDRPTPFEVWQHSKKAQPPERPLTIEDLRGLLYLLVCMAAVGLAMLLGVVLWILGAR